MIEGKTILSAIPSPVKRLLVGKKIEIDNQILNLNSQLLLKLFYRATGNKICNLTPKNARIMIDRFVNMFHNQKKLNKMCDISNDILHCNDADLPIRIYRPHNASKIIPTLVYYHGGGFVIGTLDMYDYLCATFSSQCNIQVVSVDYRLAPEHYFPAQLEDGVKVYNALLNQQNYSPDQIAIG